MVRGTGLKPGEKATSAKLARAITKVSKKVAKVARADKPEEKYFDVLINRASVDWNGLVDQIDAVTQGSTGNQRVGNKISLNSGRLRFSITNNSAGAATAQRVRMVIVCDKQNLGTPPIVSDLFEAGYIGTVDAVNAPYNRNNEQARRWKIIYDKTICLNSQFPSIAFNRAIKLRGINQSFNNAAVYGRNSVFMFLVSDIAPLGSNPSCRGVSRVLFTDA